MLLFGYTARESSPTAERLRALYHRGGVQKGGSSNERGRKGEKEEQGRQTLKNHSNFKQDCAVQNVHATY